MSNGPNSQDDKKDSGGAGFAVSPPTVSLPKGGGAIRGIGEKFAANPVTGTGSMTVPIATSPGRSGFGPQLSLSYDSGAGNGPFGFGWSLSLPAITRKTDKGLPQYLDAVDSDVFILSSAEDLVPVYRQDLDGFWVRDSAGSLVIHEDELDGYRVRRYRPRIEGLFARVERWSKIGSPGDVHWRSFSKDNILTLYGFDPNSRIADPLDTSRIFSWLIYESRDDKGNGIRYLYKEEDGTYQPRPGQADPFKQAHQSNRGNASDPSRTAQRYLQRVLYGNRKPLLDDQGQRPRYLSDLPQPPTDTSADWLFEVRFDYGELDEDNPTGQPERPWFYRPDAFSSYRSGFEVRTCRRCERVLMLHHIPDQPASPSRAAQPGYRGVVRSTEFIYDDELDPSVATQPVYSFLKQVVQTGWKQTDGSTTHRSLPPVEFEYAKPIVQDVIKEVDPQSLENLPVGLDGSAYRWVDLHGEGIPGILTEQAGAWFYKRNLSPIPDKTPEGWELEKAKFAPLETVALKPNVALSGGAEFMDLAGDGQPDLVVLDGPMPGLFEHDDAESWQPFRPFTSRLNRNMRDPNLKFVDLDGDGHADVFITEDDAFVWHASLAEEGFGPARRTVQALDEEKWPRLVFSDSTQSIHLADLSGDGLTDLVRIRNGEVSYWPNLGYGRFGARVTMDNSPLFDTPDLFDQKRIRLADIDGSGTTDIIYLHGDGPRLYFNQSGNSWSPPHQLTTFPAVDDLASIQVTDLLGNGTACLVWSSPLPGDVRNPMRYIALMEEKPHLLKRTWNNLGAETKVQYAPSTKFYLKDKQDGKPWITRLPFPVHVVERITVKDDWRKTEFSTTYSYHHGYFDGTEREFRGFGRVDQIDVEDYGTFAKGNAASPYITDNKELYQPPFKTISWYHTGAFLDRQRILSQFEHEYFPHWFEEQQPNQTNVLGGFRENILPEPELDTEGLSPEEWPEALRACKGMPLRQEVYELDVDALQGGEHRPIKLFTAAYHNCCIRRLQPRSDNRHAVFLVAESEAVTYHYELDLKPATLRPDPRIAHTLNLQYDEYANVLQSVAVVYPRQGKLEDDPKQAEGITDSLPLIHQLQEELHLAYTETRYTDDFGSRPEDKELSRDNHRLRVPCEILTYELTGIRPEDADDLASLDLRDNLYFALDELRRFRLSPAHQETGEPVTDLAYHQQPDRNKAEKRLVEHVRMLFFKDDEPTLEKSLPLGQLGRLGLPFENYKLALTKELLDSVFVDDAGTELLDLHAGRTSTARQKLDAANISGYLSGQTLKDRFSKADPTRFTQINTDSQYWIRSGIAGFEQDAAQHFYLPERYTDPFGNVTTLEYDDRDLFIKSSTDHLNNRTEVAAFDYRILAPAEIKDLNDNYSAMAFDVLGLPVASAVMGKDCTESGDSLADLRPDLTMAEVSEFLTQPYNAAVPLGWLKAATVRFVYDLGEAEDKGQITYCHRPASACSIMREKHVNQLQGGDGEIQVAVEYSDGIGAVLVRKAQAEPAEGSSTLRWIAAGKTIINNKGKPVKQYEPYFSETEHRFDPTEAAREVGVTPVLYYDAVGRLIRTELPDGSFSRVEFSPWHVASYDPNDTVTGSQWYIDRGSPDPKSLMPTDAEPRAAWLAAQHADTPSMTILDSLGREVVTVAHNRIKDPNGIHDFGGEKYKDVKYLTFTKLDAEGKPLWIRDARGNLVMQYITPAKANNDPSNTMPTGSVPSYDIAGNLLFQHSMDAGDRWMIMDAAGKPMLAWDINETPQGNVASRELRIHSTDYDALHRPTAQWLVINAQPPIMAERYEYQDALPNDANNLNGQLVRHYDPSGVIATIRRDFKGNVLQVQRTLNNQPKQSVIDWQNNPNASLDEETYIQITEYDALNRMTRLYNWHREVTMDAGGTELPTPGASDRVAIYEPTYNERGLLIAEWLHVRAKKSTGAAGHAVPNITGAGSHQAIEQTAYNEKGQRVSLRLGNGTLTQYEYDDKTFRLKQIQTSCPSDPSGFPQRRSNLSEPGIVQQLLYFYDPVGNITEVEDQAYKPVFFQNAIVEPRNLYEYDALYRLTFAKGRENGALIGAPNPAEGDAPEVAFPVADPNALRIYTQTYCYDTVGNIVQMHHQAGRGTWTRDYAYAFDDPNQAASNRLWQTWDGGDRTQATTYGYDAHGNMLNLANTDPRFDLQWDHRDMVHEIDLGGGGAAYYQYDAGKQRTRKRIVKQNGTDYWERIYLGGLDIYREYIGGNLVKRVESIHLVDGDQRLLMVEDVSRRGNNGPETDLLFRYQYSNHLGSAVLELNEHAKIISYEEYHPYGTSAYRAVNADIRAEAKRYRYTGKERDEESGLYYHGARYYASWLGRWVSEDPMGLRDGPNVFCYVRDNPILLLDPNGMAPAPYNPLTSTTAKSAAKTAHNLDEQWLKSQGYYTEREHTTKAGKGGSRADTAGARETKGSFTTKTVESKALNMARYKKHGSLHVAKITAKITKNLLQVKQHMEHMELEKYFDPATGGPVQEVLSYTVRNATPAQFKHFTKILDQVVSKFNQAHGTNIQAQARLVPRVALASKPKDTLEYLPKQEPLKPLEGTRPQLSQKPDTEHLPIQEPLKPLEGTRPREVSPNEHIEQYPIQDPSLWDRLRQAVSRAWDKLTEPSPPPKIPWMYLSETCDDMCALMRSIGGGTVAMPVGTPLAIPAVPALAPIQSVGLMPAYVF
jgi:RHS repeat-associated protein